MHSSIFLLHSQDGTYKLGVKWTGEKIEMRTRNKGKLKNLQIITHLIRDLNYWAHDSCRNIVLVSISLLFYCAFFVSRKLWVYLKWKVKRKKKNLRNFLLCFESFVTPSFGVAKKANPLYHRPLYHRRGVSRKELWSNIDGGRIFS